MKIKGCLGYSLAQNRRYYYESAALPTEPH
nr:MAG TPA: hypothetical protein [Caudoviricetes sp.]DAK80271.1 MAG TPA: hypothetical protein [Caudoviricetes sp.]